MMMQTAPYKLRRNYGPALFARKPATAQSPIASHWNWAAFAVTVFMTYLTFVKECGLYYNEWHNWRALAYLLAMKTYYPLLLINLIVLLSLARQHLARRKACFLLAATTALFSINLVLFTLNNFINLVEGQPLHSPHRGIGW